MKDRRNTSRSKEINVNSFIEELGSSDGTGRLVETKVNQTRPFEDSKSLNDEQTHDRTGRLVTDTAAVQDDSRKNHEVNTLNVDDEVLRKRMEKSTVHDENHEPMMVNEADMDFKIPGLPYSVVKHAQSTSARELIQKIENKPNGHALQQDLQQNESFNPPSPESKQTIRHVGNIELCELVETEPKKQCPAYVYHIGTLAFSTPRAGISFVNKEGRISNSSSARWTFFQFRSTFIKKGRPYGHRYGKKLGDREHFSANQLKKKCKKKFFQGIHDRFIRDETFCNRMIENGRDEDVCRQWYALADEDHTPQEYFNYKSNWWLISNKTGSNTVLVEHRSDFKQALSILQQLKEQEEEETSQTCTNFRRNQQWAQSSFSAWWSWQGSWWTPFSI